MRVLRENFGELADLELTELDLSVAIGNHLAQHCIVPLVRLAVGAHLLELRRQQIDALSLIALWGVKGRRRRKGEAKAERQRKGKRGPLGWRVCMRRATG